MPLGGKLYHHGVVLQAYRSGTKLPVTEGHNGLSTSYKISLLTILSQKAYSFQYSGLPKKKNVTDRQGLSRTLYEWWQF